MYRKIVAAKTRAVWRSINARDLDVPWKMAAEDMSFTFVGATPLGASFVGRDQFRAWLGAVFERFPDITFELREVIVAGWPWRTRIARAPRHRRHARRRHAATRTKPPSGSRSGGAG